MMKLWLIIFDISSLVSNGFAIVSAPNSVTALLVLMTQGSLSQRYNIAGIKEIGVSRICLIRILTEGITSRGELGPKGDPFVYEDFTLEQLERLRGPQGIQGIQGEKGEKGNDGYTPLKGIDYFDGELGPKGNLGEQGIQGILGPKGDTYTITLDDYTAIALIVEEKITIPTKTSELTNDSGFITSSYHDNTKLDVIEDANTTEIENLFNT